MNGYERETVFPNHLGKQAEFVLHRIRVGTTPRGIVLSPDGSNQLTSHRHRISPRETLSMNRFSTLENGSGQEVVLRYHCALNELRF